MNKTFLTTRGVTSNRPYVYVEIKKQQESMRFAKIKFKKPLEKLRLFEGQPFRVRMDESMAEFAESIKSYGVLTPISVRLVSKNEYEI